jgi:mannitol-1-/sugar-/sorbitol-6-/2-deoxyglucose-6-phosphatase
MTHPEAIIFDMDGLLVDSEPVWEEAETAVLQSHGVHMERHVREQLVGLRNDEFIGRLRDIYKIPVSAERLQTEVISALMDIIPHKVIAKPGAAEILAYSNRSRIPIAIASSSPMVIIEAMVKSQGWEQIVPVRCSADFVPNGKPAPDVYLEAARQLSAAPDKCLALEDSPNGARAAVAAGMTCYAVPDLAHTRIEAFEGITPHLFDNLHSVLRQLMVL